MFSKSRLATVLLGITLLSTAAFAGGKNDSRAFLKTASHNGRAEISLANLALRMASNPDIQAFAKHMIEDHTAANNRIMDLAKADKVTLGDDLSPKRKSVEKKLEKMNDQDREFDRAYLNQTIKDHEKSIKLFKKQADHGTDAEVRAFAAETLPKLKKHLEMAMALNTKLNTKNNMN
ncbi:MAG: putative outer membrane protein [Fibrobacteria bacterium]|jgi:putative membrane protein|nr:putative outer membrane protein [Fibrobacteria bacterium]